MTKGLELVPVVQVEDLRRVGRDARRDDDSGLPFVFWLAQRKPFCAAQQKSLDGERKTRCPLGSRDFILYHTWGRCKGFLTDLPRSEAKKGPDHHGPALSACQKSLAEFRARRREIRSNHFPWRPVRQGKYFSARKCASCPSQTDSECAQRAASPLSESPAGVFRQPQRAGPSWSGPFWRSWDAVSGGSRSRPRRRPSRAGCSAGRTRPRGSGSGGRPRRGPRCPARRAARTRGWAGSSRTSG